MYKVDIQDLGLHRSHKDFLQFNILSLIENIILIVEILGNPAVYNPINNCYLTMILSKISKFVM